MKLGITLIMFPYLHCRLRRLGGKHYPTILSYNLKLTSSVSPESSRHILSECIIIHKTSAGYAHITHAHHSDFVWVSSSKTKDQYLVFTYKGKNLAKTSSCSLHSFTKQSDPKPTMLYGVPLGPPALSLLGQRCQGAKLQRQKCEDKGAKVRRCEVEVWRLCTAKAKVQNYEGWYYYHSFAYKICFLIFAICYSIFALLLSHLNSFAFALHRIRRWNLDRTNG